MLEVETGADRKSGRGKEKKRLVAKAKPRVLAPAIVDIPMHKAVDEEVCVPASINGRNLADGRP